MIVRQKAYAFITKGLELLVFKQPDFPEGGIQLPGGTMEPGEAPAEAVMREAQEETGLSNLVLGDFLGETEFDRRIYGKEVIDHRYFYHLICPEAPERWAHGEFTPSEGENEPIVFDFYWVALFEGVMPEIIAEQGSMIGKLKEKLG